MGHEEMEGLENCAVRPRRRLWLLSLEPIFSLHLSLNQLSAWKPPAELRPHANSNCVYTRYRALQSGGDANDQARLYIRIHSVQSSQKHKQAHTIGWTLHEPDTVAFLL